ncbi:MAG: aminoacetone oxidase family FAD-binding enzyme [Sulfurovum sp.]|nr:aminoacetone oxidase family FAD-binding enzyme [Sulfurovum sp.]
MNHKNIIIIGAGASGLISAIVLAREGKYVLVLEQNNKVGKKILVSGNGKCNITNKDIHINRFYSHNLPFVAQVLQGYDFTVVEHFFHSIGLCLSQGKEGQMFPLSLQASSVVTLLVAEATRLGVEILCDAKVTAISKKKDTFIVESTQGQKQAQQLLIASGSPASPQLGGSNSGYAFASKMGHTLLPRHPSLVQLCSEESWVKVCAGVKVAGLAKLYANGQYIAEKKGDLLFTKYGD